MKDYKLKLGSYAPRLACNRRPSPLRKQKKSIELSCRGNGEKKGSAPADILRGQRAPISTLVFRVANVSTSVAG